MPTAPELKLRRREDSTFPSLGVFQRFGAKATLAGKIADYCRDRADHADVLEIVMPLLVQAPDQDHVEESAGDAARHGFVYLLKSGRHYKVGHTLDASGGADTTLRFSSRTPSPKST
jgi:hypothetical protein